MAANFFTSSTSAALVTSNRIPVPSGYFGASLITMGATRGAVMRIFLVAGMSIGTIGTLIGFLLGVLFCDNIETIRQILMKLTGTNLFNPEIYFLSHMPAE